MNVQFNIKKLGPINNLKFDLKPFMIFSGESSTGKSYASFLIYYFYKAVTNWNEIIKFIDLKIPRDSTENIRELTLNANEFKTWFNDNAIEYIKYLIGNKDLIGDVEIMFDLGANNLDISIVDTEMSPEDKTNDSNLTGRSITINNEHCLFYNLPEFNISINYAIAIAL